MEVKTETSLIALAERCEAATGPDRELDKRIFLHAGDFSEALREMPPAYTASLDAAMTLVPKGWYWRTDQGRNAGGACFKADSHEQIFTLADAPALALCAAALRARAT